MLCAAALSTSPETASAFAEVIDRVAPVLGGPADLAVAFASPHHAGALGRFAAEAERRDLARHLLAVSGESILGEDREVEGAPALSLWAARFPDGSRVVPLRLAYDGEDFSGWPPPADDATPHGHDRILILLGDPFTFPADRWLKHLATAAPGLRVAGGMASGGAAPGRNRLVLDGAPFSDGAVAALVSGPMAIRTVVSQGCRPVGRPLIVTRADRSLIQELGRRPAIEVLREIFADLDEDDQARMQEGLHIGRVINEYQDTFRRGDFLVRNVLGADDGGALAITDAVRVGQTVQFHVRDAETADEDLRSLLAEPGRGRPAGALVFSCNGRGTRLFPRPHHDALALRDHLGPIPAAGFFAMGEVGPVGGQNFLHGYTASIAIFSDCGLRNADCELRKEG